MILLVDDAAAVRRVLRLALEAAGYSVQEAESGRVALGILEEAECDLLIADISMADGDGLELILQVRKSLPALKVIAMSGGPYLQAAADFGAVSSLAKPFDLSEFLSEVRRVLAIPPG